MKSLLPAILIALLLLAGCKKQKPDSSQSANPAPAPSVAQASTPASTPVSSPEAPASPPPDSSVLSSSPNPEPESRPHFINESANEFVASYDAFISDFKAAYEAMKQRDMTKYEAVILRAKDLASKGEKLQGDLSPDEQKQFADYLSRRADELNEMTRSK
jgi:hypothetical protein